MKFFYLEGDREEPVGFADQNGNQLFQLDVLKPGVKNIPDSSIYIASNNDLNLLAQAIAQQFNGKIIIKLFSSEYIKNNNLVKPVLLGHSSLFGSGLLERNMLLDCISEWKNSDKKAVSIAVLGGYGSDYTRALISSSVMTSALVKFEEAGIEMGVDLYIDKSKPSSMKIAPYLQPVNTINGYPVSLSFLNGYDAIWVTEEENMVELGINQSSNLHDFYADVFGIKDYNYRNLLIANPTTRETLAQTLLNLKTTPNQKTIFLDFSGMDQEFAEKMALEVFNRFPGAFLITLSEVPFSNDLEIINLSHLSKDFSDLGSLMSLIDGFIGFNSFYVHLAAVYGVPTILLTRSNEKTSMYQYYQHLEVLMNVDNLFNKSDSSVMSELDRYEQSFKSIWSMFDESIKKHLDSIKNNENSSVEEVEIIKNGSLWKRPIFWIGLASSISILGVAAYLLGG